MKNVKKIFIIVAVIAVCLLSVGCSRQNVYTISANETAFLIPLSGNTASQASFESEELLAEAKVATKQIFISESYKKLGFMKWEWVADNMLIIVNRTPETREWSSTADTGTSNRNQAIQAESKESIGFSVGMNCSAQIYSEEDAVKFLYSYNNLPLSTVMDTEIRARVETDFIEQCAKYTMNEILVNKETIMSAVRNDVVTYFAERGITITVLGMKDGIEYDNPSVQEAIEKQFKAERELSAQEAVNERIISEATAQAEANRIISDSISDTLIEQQMIEAWDGHLPTVVVGDSASSMMIDIGDIVG